MTDRIKIRKLPLNETTKEGPYWVEVDGSPIGINNRTHWDSEAAALLAAETFINSTDAA